MKRAPLHHVAHESARMISVQASQIERPQRLEQTCVRKCK
jgi:hypothetical protein